MTSTKTADIDEDLLAETFRADLHKRCTYFGRRRNLECQWAPSGYCSGCGRKRPSLW